MQEILFKAKRIDNGEWVHGDISRTFEHDGIHAYIWVRDDSEYLGVKEFEVDPETVLQYTNRTDKNGDKIFDGDKVKVCLDPEIKTGIVRFIEEISCFCIDFDDGFVTFLDFAIAQKKVHENVWVEVIGNIHDKE